MFSWVLHKCTGLPTTVSFANVTMPIMSIFHLNYVNTYLSTVSKNYIQYSKNLKSCVSEVYKNEYRIEVHRLFHFLGISLFYLPMEDRKKTEGKRVDYIGFA